MRIATAEKRSGRGARTRTGKRTRCGIGKRRVIPSNTHDRDRFRETNANTFSAISAILGSRTHRRSTATSSDGGEGECLLDRRENKPQDQTRHMVSRHDKRCTNRHDLVARPIDGGHDQKTRAVGLQQTLVVCELHSNARFADSECDFAPAIVNGSPV